MATSKYSAFIARVAAHGFPVKFLREVEANYTIIPGATSVVLPWFDLMLLDPDEFTRLESMKAPAVGAGTESRTSTTNPHTLGSTSIRVDQMWRI